MTNEEAITYWEQLKKTFSESLDHATNELEKKHLQTSIDAIDAALLALRNLPTGEPMTLEQMREMDGKPVWIEFEDGSGGLWGIVHKTVFYQVVFANGLHCTIGQPYYGKTYKAYAYPPAHIDREAWTSCEFCSIEMNCTNCDHADRPTNMEPCASCILTTKGKTNWKYSKSLYCRVCGRPLTEEAWSELEKRLRG